MDSIFIMIVVSLVWLAIQVKFYDWFSSSRLASVIRRMTDIKVNSGYYKTINRIPRVGIGFWIQFAMYLPCFAELWGEYSISVFCILIMASTVPMIFVLLALKLFGMENK